MKKKFAYDDHDSDCTGSSFGFSGIGLCCFDVIR